MTGEFLGNFFFFEDPNHEGLGDIFSTVFSFELYSSGNLILSGELANEIAAKSTQYIGLKSINSNVFNKALRKK